MDENLSLPAAERPKRKKTVAVLAILALLMAGAFLFWQQQRSIIRSDMAMVEGHSFVLPSPVSGRIKAVHVAEGQEVSYGTLLVSMDEAPLVLALREAEANYELALQGRAPQVGPDPETSRLMEDLSAQVQQFRSTIQTNQQYLEHWSAEHAKAMLVLRSPNAGAEARDKAINEEAYARSQMEQARSTVESINRQRGETEARLQRIRQATQNSLSPQKQVQLWHARVSQAQTNLDNALLYSPDNGLVSGLTAREGQMVSFGQPLMNLVAGGNMEGAFWVTAHFDGKALGLHVGQECKIKLDTGETLQGQIATVTPDSRGYTVKANLTDEIPAGVSPGTAAVVSARINK